MMQPPALVRRIAQALVFGSACCAGLTTQGGEPDEAGYYGLTVSSDSWTNLRGGREEGGVWIANAVGWWDSGGAPETTEWPARLYVSVLYNNGNGLSEPLIGDRQVVSNIEADDDGLRAYEAWLEFNTSDTGSLRFGLYDLNSEFDVLESATLFLNSAHGIGTDLGQSGLNGPSIFPVTGFAVRYLRELPGAWLLRLAAMDGVPGDTLRNAPFARPQDTLGLAFAWAGAWSEFRRAEALSGRETARGEASIEATYRVELSDNVFVQPDLQYLINPGLDPDLADAWALGIRVELELP